MAPIAMPATTSAIHGGICRASRFDKITIGTMTAMKSTVAMPRQIQSTNVHPLPLTAQ